MPRAVFDESRIHPAIRQRITERHRDLIQEVEAAIAANDIVVVGMAMNPHPRRARKALDAIGMRYAYLEYGSYLGGWRRRNALSKKCCSSLVSGSSCVSVLVLPFASMATKV